MCVYVTQFLVYVFCLQFYKPWRICRLCAYNTILQKKYRYTNRSIDFAISHNEWPVRFSIGEEKTELVTRFSLFFWVKYISLMKTQPLPQSAIAQKVLKYILVHPELVVKTWRNRIYYYSSGTTFEAITSDLVIWMSNHERVATDEEVEGEENEYDGPDAEKLLKNVSDCLCVCVHLCLK